MIKVWSDDVVYRRITALLQQAGAMKLDDSDVGSQQAAVNAVSALVSAFPEIKPDVLSKIRRLLQSKSIPAKLNSLSIYVNIQGEGYPDELLLASKDSDPTIRQKAISLMGSGLSVVSRTLAAIWFCCERFCSAAWA